MRVAGLDFTTLDEDALADGVWRRLSARQPSGATLVAITAINRASATQIRSLHGIGHKMAESIIAKRPYRSVNDLLRVKGILCLRDEDRPVVIHGVHHIFHPPVRLDAWPDADHRSRIVFITRGLPQPEVEALAREARVLTG